MGAVAGDDPGDVRAVPEAVGRGQRGRVGDDVGHDPRAAVRVAEVGQITGDAGVDDRHADALPVTGVARPQSLSAAIAFGKVLARLAALTACALTRLLSVTL